MPVVFNVSSAHAHCQARRTLWPDLMAADIAAKIKHYIEHEATEPISLSQMAINGVCSYPSKEERAALMKLLERDSVGLVYKDIPVRKEEEENVRIYWRKGHNKEKGHMHPNSLTRVADRVTPPMLVSGLQPPTVRSRRPFISPARSGSGGREHIQKSYPFYMPSKKNPMPTLNCSRTCDKIGGLQDADSLARDILKLKETVERLESEVGLMAEEYSEEELQQHIDRLHEYNEVKDMGQLLLGKLAEVEGTTTAAIYQRFELELDN